MIEVQELFSRLKPFYGKKMDDLWRVYLMEDRDGKNQIENTLQIMESNLLGKSYEQNEPSLVPPSQDAAAGPFYLGDVVYGGKKLFPFGLFPNECNSHICITGATGRGKSNICMHFIKNLLKEDIKWCLFDFKRSVRDVLSDPIPHGRTIQIFTVGRNVCPFRYNPLLPPPGIDPRTWIDRVIDLLTKVQYVGLGVASLLRKAIDYVYKSVGMYKSSPILRQPTLQEVLKYLQDYRPRGREISWMSSTIRSLEALCFGEMGKILNSQNPIDLKAILDMNVVFELDSLSNNNKVFFVESLLTYFHAYRLYQGGDEILKHVFIVEEAHRILKKSDYQASTHESILDIWVTEARQLGEGLVIIGQNPSIFPAIALGNTYTTICLNLKHSSDISTMSRVLLLKEDQKEMLGKLNLGKAIVKLQGRWLSPFLIDIPLYPIQKGSVNDEKLRQLMTPYSARSVEKSTQNELVRRFQVCPDKDKHISEVNVMDSNIKNDLSITEREMLFDIYKNPGSGIVERYKRLHLSRRKGNNYKQSLILRQLIKEIPIITKKGKILLVELTWTGKNILKGIDANRTQRNRTGGAIHEFWKNIISSYYQSKGYMVFEEKPLSNGKTVDIVVENQDKKIAIEVETGNSDTISNLKKVIEAGFDDILIIAVNEDVLTKIKHLASRANLTDQNVRFLIADGFL
jgi:DNA helicase HerA-like ATPase